MTPRFLSRPRPEGDRTPAHRTEGAGTPAHRTGPSPVPLGGTGVDAPLHDAGVLGLVARPGRDHWWRQLGPKVRERIAARVGPTVEWWADCHSVHVRRPHAVVLGERGLALCRPTVNDRGGPAQELTVLPFVPSSLRHAVVVERPRRRFTGQPPLPGDGAPAGASADLPLPERLRGFLGNLPEEAQARLQWPFVNGDVLDRSDHHYTGTEDALDVWCYLAGRRWVTFVSGHGSGLTGPAHRRSWQLICRRAEVARR